MSSTHLAYSASLNSTADRLAKARLEKINMQFEKKI
jgi:hypothetical protein